MPSIDTLAQAYARKRKPPRQLRGGGPAYFIPGFGEQRTKRLHSGSQIAHDNSIPKWKSSHPIRKAPYLGKRRSRVSYD